MTASQLKKHGKVIKWLCDNPDARVWCKLPGAKSWVLCAEVSFNIDCEYIQDDKYSELRKAHADGKQLQYYNTKTGMYNSQLKLNAWHDTDNINVMGLVNHQRIKPAEPCFKTGDWVVCKGAGKDDIWQISISSDLELIYSNLESKFWTSAEKWQPVEDEYVSYKVKDEKYTVCRYKDSMHVLTDIAPLAFTKYLRKK